MNSDKVFYLIITLVTIAIFAGILFLAAKPNSTNNSSTQNNQTIPVEELVGDNPHTNLSINNAKLVIVEFADFQCPACKAYWSQVVQIKEEFGDKVAVVYRHLPLTSIHNYSFNASKASEAAAKQNKFFEYHDILYRNQSDNNSPLTDDDFISYVEELNLDIEKFKQDYNSQEVEQAVQEDRDYALGIGINSTPTFFINGEKFNGSSLYEEVKARLSSIQEENKDKSQQKEDTEKTLEENTNTEETETSN